MYPFTIRIYASGTQYITFTEADAIASKVLSHGMKHDGNKPRQFSMTLSNLDTATARNYLGAFTGWTASYVGPIEVGMEVRYDTIEMALPTGAYTTASETFYGIIQEVTQTNDGVILIKANDFSERFEHISVSKTAFSTFYDDASCNWASIDTSENAGVRLAIALPTTNPAYPLVKAQFATGDELLTTSFDVAVSTAYTLAESCWLCQSFVAPANGIYFMRFKYKTSAGWTVGNGHVVARIQRDTGANRPDIYSTIATSSMYLDYSAGIAWEQETIINDSYVIVRLNEGEKYWWSVENHNSAEPAETVSIGYNSAGTYKSDGDEPHFYYRTSGGVYTEVDGNAEIQLWMTKFSDCGPDTYHLEKPGATLYLVLDKSPGQWEGSLVPIHGANYPTLLQRGRVSCYAGDISVHNIFDAVVPLDYEYFGAAGNRSIDANLTETQKLFRLKGKTLGAGLRELCDLMANNVTAVLYQSSMAVYRPSGTHQLRVGKRSRVTDGYSYSLSYADWIESIDATQTMYNRPARIVVIGKTTANGTITATVEDDDWRIKCKIPLTETIQDESIQTVADAYARAIGALETYKKLDGGSVVWEGRMRLAGIFPQLMQEHSPTTGCGDGAVIRVSSWPDLCWTNMDLKVTSITLGEDYTDVQFSNADILYSNKFALNLKKSQLTESFVSPTDSEAVLYLPIYTNTGWSWDTYIDLCTAAGTPIAGYFPTKGTQFNMTNPVRRIWHFEIDASNGYTVDGQPVERLEFYTSYAKSSLIWTLDFSATMSAAYEFYKWKSTKVIIDLVINPS